MPVLNLCGKNSTPLFCRIFFLILLFVISARSQHQTHNIIQLQGFVPPHINKWSVAQDYTRIWKIVSPSTVPSAQPLYLIFFTQKNSVTANRLPDWGGGGLIDKDTIIVRMDAEPFFSSDLSGVISHELVHSVIARAYPDVNVPRWFHEGMAMQLSGELVFEEQIVLSRAILTGQILTISSIDSVNLFSAEKARLAYAQSHVAVAFLTSTEGVGVLSAILDSTATCGDFWDGALRATGISRHEFESRFRAHLISKYQLLFLISDFYLGWVLITILFIIGAIVAIFRKKRKMREMALGEQLAIGSSASLSAQIPVIPQQDQASANAEWDPFDGNDDIELEDEDGNDGIQK